MLLGNNKLNQPTHMKHDALTTHAAVFGSTGSGKTGLLLGMVEELYDSNVPVILVDIKGDMLNVALNDERLHVRCLTPGATHGEAVNVLSDLEDPEKASTVISALLSMIGEDPDPLTSTAHVFLTEVLNDLEKPTLTNLVWGCQSPRFSSLGALSLDEAFPKRARSKLLRKMNTLLVSPSFKAWRIGMDLELDEVVADGGITIYSVAHLTDADEQSFAVSFLLNEVLRWTRQQPGSSELRLVLAIDECVGLLPPHPANPPTKRPIMLLLKQARAFGVGLILATQNPVDIDYKAMSNCNTWFVGRMTAQRDRDRVVAGMVTAGLGNDEKLHDDIASLKSREFIVNQSGRNGVETFKSRNVACQLPGPMIPSDVEEMYDNEYLSYPNYDATLSAERARVALRGPIEKEDSISVKDVPAYNLVVEDYEDLENYFQTPEPDYYDELPTDLNVVNSAIGLGLLGAYAYGLMQVFEVTATFLKGVL